MSRTVRMTEFEYTKLESDLADAQWYADDMKAKVAALEAENVRLRETNKTTFESAMKGAREGYAEVIDRLKAERQQIVDILDRAGVPQLEPGGKLARRVEVAIAAAVRARTLLAEGDTEQAADVLARALESEGGDDE